MELALSIVGYFVMLGIAYGLSRDRKAVSPKVVGAGMLSQWILALILLRMPGGADILEVAAQAVTSVLNHSFAGSSFVYGELGKFGSGTVGEVMPPTNTIIFAFQVLPTIVFVATLFGVLYYLGVMQWVVEVIARSMVKLLGTSGAETLSASANIFIGQTEAPLFIKPYVEKLTRSELMVVMTGGFATVAGGVMAAYVALLRDQFPGIAGHLMAASLMSRKVFSELRTRNRYR